MSCHAHSENTQYEAKRNEHSSPDSEAGCQADTFNLAGSSFLIQLSRSLMAIRFTCTSFVVKFLTIIASLKWKTGVSVKL